MYSLPQFCVRPQCTLCLNVAHGLRSVHCLNVQSASNLRAASMYSLSQICVRPQCTVCLNFACGLNVQSASILRAASMYTLPQFCARPQCTVCLNFACGFNIQSASILRVASMYSLPQFCAWPQCTVCLNFARCLKSARGLNVQSASILHAASMYKIGLNVQRSDCVPQCIAVHWGRFHTLMPILYIEAESLHITLRQNRPQCTESASMYSYTLRHTIRELYIADWCTLRHSQSESCTLRPIPYIEADSVHWGRISAQYIEAKWASMYGMDLNVQLSDWLSLNVQLSDWLRQLTWENKLNLPQCTEFGLNVQNRPQCTDRPQCTANQTAVHWGTANERAVHWGRFWKCSDSLTFDSNSSSDRNLSDVLKTVHNYRNLSKSHRYSVINTDGNNSTFIHSFLDVFKHPWVCGRGVGGRCYTMGCYQKSLS